jgi:hypothetical protein
VILKAFAQTGNISGKVINSVSYDPLPFATIFINHTTIGTGADENGDFILKNIPLGQHELVVMFVGHDVFQMKVNLKDTVVRSFTIKLTSKPLREIQVTSERDTKWKKQYERFKKLFLGNSIHASRCRILNPWVLDFSKSDDGFFVATANDVLEIENHSLGYKLFYMVEKFSYGSTLYQIGGTVRFEVIEPPDTTAANTWAENREKVYAGSERHLFKSIVDKQVRQQGFNLYKDETGLKDVIRLAKFESNFNDDFTNYSTDNLVIEETGPNKFEVPMPARLEVHFLKKKNINTIYRDLDYPVSWIEVKGGHLVVDNRGIVLNPAMMVLSGNMSSARIAELLPYDFQPVRSEALPVEVERPKEKVNALSYLLEKPYLHTDKSYYYPNEMLWLKGYMSYKFPVFRDSLSRVAYVELISTSKEIVVRKILPIHQGSIIGNFVIPRSLSAGDYTLRAYTRWMLNFDERLIFTKPIKIMDHTEVARPVHTYIPIDSANELTMILSKDTFRTRELVTVTSGVTDFLDNFTPSTFSIAVTDLNQAVPASNERTITNDFAIPDIVLPDTIHSDKFLIQYGIDLKGQLSTKKGKPIQGTLKLLQENTSEDLTVITEENGTFSFSNLILFDSTKLFGQAKTIHGLNAKFSIDSSFFSPNIRLTEQLNIEVYKSENPSRYNTWDKLLNGQLLKEITIEDTRLEGEGKRTAIVASDFSISGDRLRANNTSDVLLALKSMVPGLRVIQGMIVLGEASTFGSPEPLILIDGMAVNGFDGPGGDSFGNESAAERISNMTVQEIERIEVSKYSSGAAYGARGSNGVISITTRKPGTSGSHLVSDKRKFEEVRLPRFSASSKFHTPDYSDPKEEDYQRPDYRATIYWNPYLMTDSNNTAKVSFYSADIPTQYRILVEGITKDGIPVRGEKIITIIAKP